MEHSFICPIIFLYFPPWSTPYTFSTTTWIYSIHDMFNLSFSWSSIASWEAEAVADLESQVEKSNTLYEDLFNQVSV